jgi:hypothetical protein
MKSSMASLCHNLYWHQRLYGTDFLHLTFFAQNTTKTGKDVGFGISIVLNICETPVVLLVRLLLGVLFELYELYELSNDKMVVAPMQFEINFGNQQCDHLFCEKN